MKPSATDNPHIAFGHGAHFCLGAPLARVEARIAPIALLARFPDRTLAVPAERLRWRENVLIHGLFTLPIRLHTPTRKGAPR